MSEDGTNTGGYANEGVSVSNKLLSFLLLGIAMVFIGMIVLIVASLVIGNSGNFSGIILIGPIPIIFGSGSNADWLIIISAILTIFSLIFFVIMNRKSRRFSG